MSYNLGILFILVVAIIWSASSIIAQFIYFDLGFQSPFLFTFITTSLFALYIPLYHIRKSSVIDSQPLIEQYKHSDMFCIALRVAPCWFLANCLYNYSLLWTSVTSSTIISNSSGVFTLTMACMAGLEVFSAGKLLGTVLSFAGVVIIAVRDSEASSAGSSSGDILALLAAAGYGLYTTVLRCQVPDDSVPMDLMLGYVGLINIICLSPIVIIMACIHIDNVDKITLDIILIVSANGIFDQVISDYIWARAVVLTSPTVATVGMSITIPFAIISDLIIHGIIPGYASIVGSLMVLCGFVWVTVGEQTVQDLGTGKKYDLAPICDDNKEDEIMLVASIISENGALRS